jgi:hypothetical protein
MAVRVIVRVADVFEIDLGLAHGVPRVPSDLEDDERDRQADNRIGDLGTERNDNRARDTPSETKPSMRAWFPSAVIAALARRLPARSQLTPLKQNLTSRQPSLRRNGV